MDTHGLLILGHIIGAVLGVGGATFIEINLNIALKDSKMEPNERLFMAKAFLVTRIGMILGILTGIGFVLEYYLHGQTFRLVDGVFWAKLAIVGVIVVNAVLLHLHKIGLYWGSAFSFVSWWVALILGHFLTTNVKILAGDPLISFLFIMAGYLLTVVVGALILDRLRNIGKGVQLPEPPKQPS
jgi:hypothetical protein